jgi:hypothetical protein
LPGSAAEHILDDSSRIVRVVGTGGFGITYQAASAPGSHVDFRRPRQDDERAAEVRPAPENSNGPI